MFLNEDRLEEVLSCSYRSKQLIVGIVESLVFADGRSLWLVDLGVLSLARGREVPTSLGTILYDSSFSCGVPHCCKS